MIASENPLSASVYKSFFTDAVDFNTYLSNFKNELEQGEKIPFYEYLPLNWQRLNRIYNHLELSQNLLEKLQNLNRKIHWLVITEHWCGDASQIIPIIEKIAENSKGNITVKYAYRDLDTTLIDAHLTNNGRAIPKVLELNSNFEFVQSWGPRPADAQQFLLETKKNPALDYKTEIHKWYAKDKQKSTIEELIVFLGLKN